MSGYGQLLPVAVNGAPSRISHGILLLILALLEATHDDAVVRYVASRDAVVCKAERSKFCRIRSLPKECAAQLEVYLRIVIAYSILAVGRHVLEITSGAHRFTTIVRIGNHEVLEGLCHHCLGVYRLCRRQRERTYTRASE